MQRSTRHTPQGRAGRRSPDDAVVEWVGGRFRLPTYVAEGEPYRPELAIWLEVPSGLVVGHALAPPDGECTLADALRGALDRHTRGAAREPRRLRVADHAAEIELRQAFRDRFPIEVAPAPELDMVLESFLRSQSASDEDDASYLEGGRVEEATVVRMFRAAAMLYRTAPWRVASDSEVLRMDVPALGVDGACVTIIGALGESLGLIIFPSLLGYERFLCAAEDASAGGSLDLGGPVLSLNLENARDLPRSMRREIAARGWPTVAPDAMPLVTHRDRDGVPRPVSERDVQVVTECAFAVSSFFERHRASFGHAGSEPVSESSTMSDTGITVRLTMPYEAADSLDGEEASAHEASVRMAKLGSPAIGSKARVGRNDPCPCGSGKKYKKCCLDSVQSAESGERRRAAAHELDERMVWTLRDFADERYGARWRAAIKKLERAAGEDTPMLSQIAAPWSAYEACVDGERVLDAFVAACRGRLSGEERDWLAAQPVARLDVWEVTSSEPGVAVSVRGLISGDVRRVSEVRGSRALVSRDAVLARVADYGGGSYFCGMYPRMLPPDAAERVAKAAKRRAGPGRERSGAARRDEDGGIALVRAWTKAVHEEERGATAPKQLVNTDGDLLVLTTDHFELDVAARSEIAAIVRGLEGVMPPEEDDGNEYTITKAGNAVHRSWENTVIGRVTLEEGRLRLEANSIARADELRARLERACGARLRHRAREHVDPQSSAPGERRAGPAPSPGPEMQAALREMKERHYAQWLDDPVPALSGKTPRQAARSKAGRERLDVLLRTMENHEQRSGQEPFDFGALRRELGLETVVGSHSAPPATR